MDGPLDLMAGIRRAVTRGHRTCALEPVATRCVEVASGGILFQIRMLVGRSPVPERAGREAPADPFLPFEEGLHVADIGPDHVCLLNKYPSLDDHLLIITRAFEHQEEALTEGDLRALWRCMAEVPGLAFYNGGATGGASQAHKHLQLVPYPLSPRPRAPIEAALERERPDGAGVLQLASLPYVCAGAWLFGVPRRPDEAAPVLLALYRRLLAVVGLPPERWEAGRPLPYDLLITPDWMLAAPRTRGSYEGIPVNALGYAGSLFVKDDAARDRLLRLGPLEVLRAVGVVRPDRAPAAPRRA